jgi:hypothetical protein
MYKNIAASDACEITEPYAKIDLLHLAAAVYFPR